jgi:hypothetical protein
VPLVPAMRAKAATVINHLFPFIRYLLWIACARPAIGNANT